MSLPHDFEFQLGPNRTLKGRGWRGVLALGLIVIGIVAASTGTAGWLINLPAAAVQRLQHH